MSKFSEELKQEGEDLKKRFRAITPSRWVLLIVMVAITICSFVFYGYIFAEDSWFTDPGTNIALLDTVLGHVPNVVTAIQRLTILYLIVTILTYVIRKAFRRSQRNITVASLICNLINWVAAIVAIVLVLAVFGVDTTAIITGAGVVTLVVGLGMQSLIADIVAGLFMVFENDFNVGDYVTIDGYRGEVISIGIRTTKVKAVGNIKIFNNSAITGVINHDIEPSVAKTLIDIEYGAKLPEVEKIIKKNVGNLKVAGALDAVSYDGVAALGASGVTLQFTVHCNEQDIFAVTRALNGAVKAMFDEKGIDIPFPQVVVHKSK